MTVEQGRRSRLGYVAGFGDDAYEVWDGRTGATERFPLTADGWVGAWRTFTAREAGETPAHAGSPGHRAEAPRLRRRRRRLAGIGTAVVVALVALSYVLPETRLLSPALLDDDFSSRDGWHVSADADGSMGYAGEAYRIATAQPEYELHSHLIWEGRPPNALWFEADVRLDADDGALSLLCVSSLTGGRELTPEDRYYDFYVRPRSGDYGILADGDGRRIGRGQRPGLFSPDGVNRIRAECRGARDGAPPRLSLHVNGVLVLEREDREGDAGHFSGVGLGVYGDEAPTAGLFDNARADEL